MRVACRFYVRRHSAGQSNLSPLAGMQFFGEVNIDRKSQALTVDLKDIDGNIVFSKTLDAEKDDN